MVKRPSIKAPKPLSQAPLAPEQMMPGGGPSPQMLAELQSEISTEAAPLWNFVLRNAAKIAAGVVALVVLLVAYGIWTWYEENRLENSRVEFGRVLSIQDQAKRLGALEEFSAKAPKELAIAIELESAMSAVALEDWDKAAAAYAKVVEQKKDGPLSLAAAFNLNDVYMRQGKYAEAVSLMEGQLQNSSGALRTMLNQYLAEAAELAGDKAKAIAAYESVIGDLGEDSSDALYYRSRIESLR